LDHDILVMGLSFAYRLIKIVFAFVLLFFVLRLFDKISGLKFTRTYQLMAQNAMAVGIYFGLRFIGAALLVAMVWGV
jgi:hypothetical protein